MIKFDNTTCLSTLCRFVLSVRLSLNLYVSEILLFSGFMNVIRIFIMIWVNYCILYLNFVCCNEMNRQWICLILFIRFLEVFPAWICASNIKNLCSIYFGGNILISYPWVGVLHCDSSFIEGVAGVFGVSIPLGYSSYSLTTFAVFIGNILLSKTLIIHYRPLRSSFAFLRVSCFSSNFSGSFGLADLWSNIYQHFLVQRFHLIQLIQEIA